MVSAPRSLTCCFCALSLQQTDDVHPNMKYLANLFAIRTSFSVHIFSITLKLQIISNEEITQRICTIREILFKPRDEQEIIAALDKAIERCSRDIKNYPSYEKEAKVLLENILRSAQRLANNSSNEDIKTQLHKLIFKAFDILAPLLEKEKLTPQLSNLVGVFTKEEAFNLHY